MSDLIKKLEEYFTTTPREKVLENWEMSKKYDEVGYTCDEYSKLLESIILAPKRREVLKNKKMKIFSIDGYFTDDNVKFTNQLVTSNEDPLPYWCGYKRDDMFFHGLDCENLPKLPATILNLFVVTSFKFIEEINTEEV